MEIPDNVIKNGSKSVTFNDGKLLMVNSSYHSATIKLSSAEKQVEKPFNLWYILADVVIGTVILVGVAYYVVLSLTIFYCLIHFIIFVLPYPNTRFV